MEITFQIKRMWDTLDELAIEVGDMENSDSKYV